jgi:hypothetical protein
MAPPRARNEEAARDVLAAEAFAVPAPDPNLRHGPVVLPEDPSGIAEPHDVLAAEEFAMPAGPGATRQVRAGESHRRSMLSAAAGALLALISLRRRRG